MDKDVLFFDIAMHESLAMGKIEGRERLLDDPYDLLIGKLAALHLGQPRRVHPNDKLCNEINKAVVRPVFDVADDMRMPQNGRDLDLTHKTL